MRAINVTGAQSMRRHIGSEYHIDASLLRIAPEIGTELRHSFAWLDDQLAIG